MNFINDQKKIKEFLNELQDNADEIFPPSENQIKHFKDSNIALDFCPSYSALINQQPFLTWYNQVSYYTNAYQIQTYLNFFPPLCITSAETDFEIYVNDYI